MLLLRPCEIRAYIELTKLTQIEREAVTAVSIDCFGALSLKEETGVTPSEVDGLKDYFKDADKMRWACKVCRERRGVVGDMVSGLMRREISGRALHGKRRIIGISHRR